MSEGKRSSDRLGAAPDPAPRLRRWPFVLGPGTTTLAAVRASAGNNGLLDRLGERGVRLYAHSAGGAFSARRLLAHARIVSDPALRLEVEKRMYAERFPGSDLTGRTIAELRAT